MHIRYRKEGIVVQTRLKLRQHQSILDRNNQGMCRLRNQTHDLHIEFADAPNLIQPVQLACMHITYGKTPQSLIHQLPCISVMKRQVNMHGEDVVFWIEVFYSLLTTLIHLTQRFWTWSSFCLLYHPVQWHTALFLINAPMMLLFSKDDWHYICRLMYEQGLCTSL